METKYSPIIQAEINSLFNKIQIYEKYFSIRIEYYIDGWAIFLEEKNLYPRVIVIFKDSTKPAFSIKSYEIHSNDLVYQKFVELYSSEEVQDGEEVLKELRALIYGKDILTYISKKYFNKVLD
jgi:hypothetical protein